MPPRQVQPVTSPRLSSSTPLPWHLFSASLPLPDLKPSSSPTLVTADQLSCLWPDPPVPNLSTHRRKVHLLKRKVLPSPSRLFVPPPASTSLGGSVAHSQVPDTFLWCVQVFLALLTPRGREQLSSVCHPPRQCQSQSLLNATAGQSWLWATEMCCWQPGCAPPLLRAVKAKGMSWRRNKALFFCLTSLTLAFCI